MAGGLGAQPEHHFRRVIPGDIETVRQRLCDVLEEFNYIVLSENPIEAKRDKTKNILASTMLDCEARLTIALKPISPASTLATFNYAVEYLFTEGDQQALEREAEAIIALAATPPDKAYCQSCGAENMGAVRFCRACGTPVALNKLPAELEVMRLTAGASSSLQEIFMGLVICLLTLLVTLPVILVAEPTKVVIGWGFFALGELLGSLCVLSGMRRLQQTIKPATPSQPDSQIDTARAIPAQERAALSPRPASVTEGTTELMNPPQKIAAPARPAKDTDPMG